jgi:hypothetical protein
MRKKEEMQDKDEITGAEDAIVAGIKRHGINCACQRGL